MTILAIVAVISLFINAYFFLRPEPEIKFDKMTSITLRLAEQKYLTEQDKMFIVHKEFMELELEEIDSEMIDIFKTNVNNKISAYKVGVRVN